MKKRKLPLIVAIFSLFTISSVSGQDYRSVVENYLKTSSKIDKNISNKEFKIDSQDPSQSMNATVVKIQQTYDGIPIFGNSSTLLVRNNDVLNYSGDFTNNQAKVSGTKLASSGANILAKAVKNIGLDDSQSYVKLLAEGKMRIPTLVYYDNGSDLVLCYELEFDELKSSNLWHVIADASTGQVYLKQNLTLSCNFVHSPYDRSHQHSDINEQSSTLVNFPQFSNVNKEFKPLLISDASYRVFPFPVEAPTFGSRSLVSNPWDSNSSPLGWHSDNSTEYTYTRGNNVYTYTDEMSTNAIGEVAEGGSSRVFDFPFDDSKSIDEYKNASITNLFYVNNKVHDILYKFGFNETAKNFQAYNFGKGGAQNDYVLAEARDGAGVSDLSLGYYNNANFSTPTDGSRPRMQMYIWLGNTPYFTYNAPSTVAGTGITPVGLGYFGPPLWKKNVTGDVAVAAILDACSALPSGSLSGKIGIAQRGTCNFIEKVKNIENAGATGAIIFNSPDAATVPGEEITNMSGDGTTTITIPSVFLPQSKGESIISMITSNQTVNVTLKVPVYDGSVDNGVIAHEYGHGLSSRTTGTSVACLNTNVNNEQMGEGWSDFLALMMTNRPGDNASVPRGIGTYVSLEDPNGEGIRPAKYSPDPAINNYTYGNTNGMVTSTGSINVHAIGFVWATMLWDLHWKYVEKYGYASDITADPNSGSARVFQTVLNGLKLQGCYPTFVMGRDGILAADQAMGGDNKCLIWNVFAKRGLGLNASAGSKTSINDQVEDFTVPAECVLGTTDIPNEKAISIYPNPARNEFNINFKNNVLGKVNVEIFDASGKLVSDQKIDPSVKEAVNTQNLVNGTYMIKVSGIGVSYTSKLIIKK